MKKLLCALAISLLCLSLLAGCGEEKTYVSYDGENLTKEQELFNLGVEALETAENATYELDEDLQKYKEADNIDDLSESAYRLSYLLLDKKINELSSSFYSDMPYGKELIASIEALFISLENEVYPKTDASKKIINDYTADVKKALDKFQEENKLEDK